MFPFNPGDKHIYTATLETVYCAHSFSLCNIDASPRIKVQVLLPANSINTVTKRFERVIRASNIYRFERVANVLITNLISMNAYCIIRKTVNPIYMRMSTYVSPSTNNIFRRTPIGRRRMSDNDNAADSCTYCNFVVDSKETRCLANVRVERGNDSTVKISFGITDFISTGEACSSKHKERAFCEKGRQLSYIH